MPYKKRLTIRKRQANYPPSASLKATLISVPTHIYDLAKQLGFTKLEGRDEFIITSEYSEAYENGVEITSYVKLFNRKWTAKVRGQSIPYSEVVSYEQLLESISKRWLCAGNTDVIFVHLNQSSPYSENCTVICDDVTSRGNRCVECSKMRKELKAQLQRETSHTDQVITCSSDIPLDMEIKLETPSEQQPDTVMKAELV